MSSNSDITVNIRLNSTVRFTLPSCTLQTTLGQVKEMISELEASGRVEPSRQRIIFKGRVLREDAQTLAEVGFEDNQTLHLVKGAAAASASSSSNNDAPSTTTANPASTTNMGGMPGMGGGMPGMMGMGGGGMPSMEQMNATMQNPLFQNLMDNMLSNPETLTALMQTNPQMQQMMENNPQLRHALEDPAVLRQAMQAMRNPDYMQQMMRNQDLAMSQIENMPGGFNHLRRMYEDVQEPMMDAMSGSAAAGSAGSGSSSSGGGANNNGTPGRGAMPNPWGAPSTSTSTTTAANNNNNTAAATPFGNMGMGGAGMMPNMNMNLDQTISMLENPAIRSMMDSLTSDPETFRRMTEANPMFQQMVRDNPAMSSMMSNPQMMRSMLDPVNLRAMQQMQNAMQTLQQNNAVNPAMNMNPWGAAGNAAGAAPVSNTNATAAGSGLDFSNLLNPAAATASSSSSSSTPSMMNMPSVVPASTRYADQINALVNMGFADRDANARALEACGGNINRAVEWLLSRS